MSQERRYWVMGDNGPEPSTKNPYTDPQEPIPNQQWRIDGRTNNGYPYNVYSMNPYTDPQEPIPNQQWRIDGRTNNGYPYNVNIPKFEYIPPPPDPFIIETEHDYIDLYDFVEVISHIHGLSLMLAVTKQEIHLDEPKKTKYTIGRNFRTSNNSLSYLVNSDLHRINKRRYY